MSAGPKVSERYGRRTKDVDHGLVENLEQGEEIENKKPEGRRLNLVVGRDLVVHKLSSISKQSAAQVLVSGMVRTSHLSKAVTCRCTHSVSLSRPLSTVSFSNLVSFVLTQSHFVSRYAFALS